MGFYYFWIVVVRLIMMFDEGCLQTAMLSIHISDLSILSHRLFLLLSLFFMLDRLIGKEFTRDLLFQVTSFLDISFLVLPCILRMCILIMIFMIDNGYIEILLVQVSM